MLSPFSRHAVAAFLSLLPTGALLAADAPSPAELRMREQLRTVMLQLRTSETERATLQAAQAEMETKNTALTTQVETMTKQMSTDKEANEKSVSDLKAVVDQRDTEIGRLNESLSQWKAAHKQITTLATNTEAQRAKLAANVILLNRQVADQQARNSAMYKIGIEVLARYEKFGLGDALTSREPFIGITRVKFENLIQDYHDKLADERIKPASASVPEQKAPPAAAPTPAPAKSSKTKAASSSPKSPEVKPKS